MSLSHIILLIWIFLVSASIRAWDIEHLSIAVLVAGIAYIVVFILERLGVIRLNLNMKDRA
jgi:hypothetical protein